MGVIYDMILVVFISFVTINNQSAHYFVIDIRVLSILAFWLKVYFKPKSSVPPQNFR